MAVDWEQFCRANSLDYDRSSSSAARGFINVHCPLCGAGDPGKHLGLHRSGRWSCYRDPINHRGQNPRRIIMLLIGCSYADAEGYVNNEEVDLSDFGEAARQFLLTDSEKKQPKYVLYLPDEFKPLRNDRGRAKIYWEYMLGRGYSGKEVFNIAKRFQLHYCDKRKWRGRIIFPMYQDSKLVSWTGRTVYDTEEIRYLSLTHNKEENPHSLISIRDVLYCIDDAMAGSCETCVVVEGPMDAVNVNYYGRGMGICAVATLGTGISPSQLDLLCQIRERVNRLIICGDKGADGNVMDLLSMTRDLGTEEVVLPKRVSDPAELSSSQIRALFASN